MEISYLYLFSCQKSQVLAISPGTVNSAKNTICDTCALNSRRQKIFDVLAHAVGITVKRSNQLGTRFVILVN